MVLDIESDLEQTPPPVVEKKSKKKPPATKAEKQKKLTSQKKEEKKPKAKKKEPAKKEKGEKKGRKGQYKKDGISALVRKMLTPKDPKSKVANCTYGEASKAVQKKHGRALYTSEFERIFGQLKEQGIVTEKLPPHFKAE